MFQLVHSINTESKIFDSFIPKQEYKIFNLVTIF